MAYQPKSYKKFVATAATATLVATAVVPAAFANEAETAAFTDVPKSYEAAIEFVVSNNISNGLTETEYGISKQIKRGDAAIIIANAAGLNDKDAPAAGFKDVPTRGALQINSLKAAGVVNGKSTTNFGFEESITRGEAAIMLQRAFKLTGDVKDVKFTDVSDRYDDAVAALLAYGVTQGTSTTKFGTENPIKRGDFAKFIYALKDLVKVEVPVPGTPAVTSVSSINAKQVEVKFATPVDKSTVLNSSDVVQNITFTNVAGTITSPGTLSGELSEDGKTLTVTASNIFDGEYAFKSTDSIKTVSGEKVPAFSAIVKADDTAAPSLLSASASAKTSTNSIALVFDEPVDARGAIVYVNGAAATITNNAENPNRLDVTTSSQLAAGSTATVSLTNVKDFNGNFISPNPLTTSVSIVADTVAPTVTAVSVVGENKVEVTYSKPMNVSSFAGKARLVTSTGVVTNLTAAAGDATNKVVFTASGLTYTDTYNGLLFIDADVKDTAGNSAAAYSSSVTLNKDVTAPALASATFEDGKISAKFTEDIARGSNATVTAINEATGVATTITLNYTPNTGNAVIKDDTLTITQALADGTYQLRLPASTVVDTAGTPNGNAITTTNFVVKNSAATDTTKPVVSSITGPTGSTGVAPGTEQVVTYNATDASGIDLATVRNVNNYTFDGKALPAGTYVTTELTTGTADKATAVKVSVNIPSAAITATKAAPFTVSNVKDNTGNSIEAVATQTVTLRDGVKPEFTSATIAANGTSLVLGFSEATQNVGAGDFQVTLNGTLVSSANLTTVSPSNTEVNKYVTGITANWANNETVDGETKDVLYIENNATPGYSAGDLVILVADAATVAADTAVTLDLSSNLVNSLKVKLVSETNSVVTDSQGNQATFNKEITVK